MRAVKAVLLVLIAAVLPSSAFAGYQSSGQVSQTFVPISGNPINVATGGTLVQNLTLPFPFKFWGVTYNSVSVGYRGYLNFTGTAGTSYSYGLPSRSTPFAIVAPWWGNFDAVAGSVSYTVTGAAPQRAITIQWKDIYYAGDSKKATDGATFQARLHETSGKVEFFYGASNQIAFSSSSRAAVGIQNETGALGVVGQACTTATSSGCQNTDFMPNSMISFVTPPDLSFNRVYADEVGYAGVPMRVGASVSNNGGDDARAVVVNFYLSDNNVLDAADTDLGPARAVDLAVGQRRDVVYSPVLPKTLKAGTYWLFAKVDPANAIAEDDETNNVGPTGGLPFSLGTSTSDLTVGTVTVPATAKAGDTLTVTRTLKNIGNALIGSCSSGADCNGLTCDAGRCRAACAQASDCSGRFTCDATKGICDIASCSASSDCPGGERCDTGVCKAREVGYAIYLSDNSVISVADRLLSPAPGPSRIAKGIAAFDEDTGTDTVTLPTDVPPGDYFIGVVVDPGNEFAEISEVNNSGASSKALTVVSTTLTVVTKTLPDAAVQAPYGVRIKAQGGSGTFTFSLASGALPRGLSLSPEGELAGIPSAEGAFSFKVKVDSSTLSATQDLTLKVSPSGVPLTVISLDLPAAEFGKPYSAQLSAVGGKAPYSWALSSGAELPPGLVLGSDGTIEGMAQVDGIFAFQAEVKDSAGAVRAQPLTLTVASPDRMRIVTSALPDAALGKAYNATLSVAGGKAPFKWEVVESRLISLDPTEPAQPGKTELPPGLALGVDKGIERLAGTPQLAGTFSITLRVSDDNKKTDLATLALAVRYDVGLEIVTQGLPDAIANKDYAAQLYTEGGDGAVKWSLTCVPTYNDANELQPCRQSLPPQFTLTEAGFISVPEGGTVTAPEADADGNRPPRTTYSFMVKARDEKGRSAVRALSITIRVDKDPPAQPVPATCQTGLGDPSLFTLLGLALVASARGLRRRRR